MNRIRQTHQSTLKAITLYYRLIGCSVVLGVSSLAHAEPLVATRDLDGDGRVERVVVDVSKTKQLMVFRGKVLLWSGVTRRVKPWKLIIADVDGDGKHDIVIGTIKATRYFPQPHPTLSIYSWNGREALKKWLGSALSRPFSDFTFANLDNDRTLELVALEYRRDKRRSLGIYSWNSFGFTRQAEWGNWRAAKLLPPKMAPRDGIAIVADGRKLMLTKAILQQNKHFSSHPKEPS